MIAYRAFQTARSCLTKRAYATRAEARRAKRVMAQRHGVVFTIYRCAHCAHFHLTHQPRGAHGGDQ